MQARFQDRERPPKRAARITVGRVRPEQRSERLARDRPAQDRDVREERDGLARVDRQGLPIDLHFDRAEQPNIDHERNDSAERSDSVTNFFCYGWLGLDDLS